jgi:hypothetical protein
MRFRFAARMYGSAWAVLDQSKIAIAALAAPNFVDLKIFLKVLEQRKPKGVASRNRRHFFRGPWTPPRGSGHQPAIEVPAAFGRCRYGAHESRLVIPASF